MNSDSPLLIVKNVSKTFGGVQALSDISFQLNPTTITGLIGPNGAGKTTLFNLISGIFPTDTGEIFFNGQNARNKKVHELVREGVARTFQNVELFENMTALENVLVGRHTRTRCGIWGSIFRFPWIKNEESRSAKTAGDLLEFVGLKDVAPRRSGDLAFGWQRLLELARALASTPRLLLLDEPAAGLNMVETLQLGDLIRKIRDQGVTVLLVEHDMSLTMEISDAIVVLDQGKKIAEGPPRSIQKNEAVMRAYLGTPSHKESR
jgi:branched-chain amino acid transport system ATP-binding protein